MEWQNVNRGRADHIRWSVEVRGEDAVEVKIGVTKDGAQQEIVLPIQVAEHVAMAILRAQGASLVESERRRKSKRRVA